MTSSKEVKAYDPLIANAMTGFPTMTGSGSEPEVIAKVRFEAVTDESDKLRYPAGDDDHRMLKKSYETSDEDHHNDMMEQVKLADVGGSEDSEEAAQQE